MGWIDSKPGTVDEMRAKLWFAPRKPGANWSALNKKRVERLIALERMREAGLRVVSAAKLSGTWDALNAVEALEIPADLALAFASYNRAASYFDAFPRFTKRAILEWIAAAKTSDTRAKRVEETARLAQDNIRANQWKK